MSLEQTDCDRIDSDGDIFCCPCSCEPWNKPLCSCVPWHSLSDDKEAKLCICKLLLLGSGHCQQQASQMYGFLGHSACPCSYPHQMCRPGTQRQWQGQTLAVRHAQKQAQC